jgi:hypothetical protein
MAKSPEAISACSGMTSRCHFDVTLLSSKAAALASVCVVGAGGGSGAVAVRHASSAIMVMGIGSIVIKSSHCINSTSNSSQREYGYGDDAMMGGEAQ